MYEYTSAVFAVGLEGFAQVDNDRITAMAADGWEPTHMASIHSGFAAVVMFRREADVTAVVTRARTATATRARKVPPAPAAPARATRGAAAPSATKRAAAAAPPRRSRTAR